MNTVVVGTQVGDEGKGRIIDYLAPQYDVVVRANSGPNAGHTIVVDGKKTILRLLPSAVLHPDKKFILGQGMALDLEVLYNEVKQLENTAFKKENLFISERAHVILPYHKLIDEMRENSTSNRIGTTRRGVGPLYEQKMARNSVRLADLLKDDMQAVMQAKLHWSFLRMPFSVLEVVRDLRKYVEFFKDNICSTTHLLNTALKSSCLLIEGAQGLLLDVDNGPYPFVTSSNCSIGGILAGSGLNHNRIDNVLGVIKGYSTKVGTGPFPTLITGSTEDHLVKVGQEFGSVTGRQRKVGWLDLPALEYANNINGCTEMAITKLDVLTGLSEIKVCTGYKSKSGYVDDYWYRAHQDVDVEPVYKTFAGWNESISHCRHVEELPKNLRAYLDFIQEYLDVPFSHISVGRDRMEMIELGI